MASLEEKSMFLKSSGSSEEQSMVADVPLQAAQVRHLARFLLHQQGHVRVIGVL